MRLTLQGTPEIQIFRRESRLSRTRQLQLLRNRLGIATKVWRYKLGRPSDRGVVICRPRGGLNDTLNQLAKAFVYTYRHKRTLVIDTSRSGLLDNWDSYFELADPSWPVVLDGHTWQPEAGARFKPEALQQCGLAYEAVVDADYRIRDGASGQEVTFNLDQPHSADVLVHEQYGGGFQGWIALELFRFTENTRQQILEATRRLPSCYTAVHVRHSDVKSNYRQILRHLHALLRNENVVVCTDSADVQIAAREELAASNVVTLHRIPQTHGVPLHGNAEIGSRDLNIATFVDLVTLAQADQLILTTATPCQAIWPGREGGYVSGFGTLAADLFDRQQLLNQLLNSTIRF